MSSHALISRSATQSSHILRWGSAVSYRLSRRSPSGTVCSLPAAPAVTPCLVIAIEPVYVPQQRE